MPRRGLNPVGSAGLHAVSLGDEIEEEDEAQRRQARLMEEQMRGRDVERWDMESSLSGGSKHLSPATKRSRADEPMYSGGLNSSSRSIPSSLASTSAIHHHIISTPSHSSNHSHGAHARPPAERVVGLGLVGGVSDAPQLDLQIDRSRLRTPSSTSGSTPGTESLSRFRTNNSDGDPLGSSRSAISSRKERLLRMAAERGVGVFPATPSEADEDFVDENGNSIGNMSGNVSRGGEVIAGLCLADEMADELEADELEELEFSLGLEFPSPPGTQSLGGSPFPHLGGIDPNDFVRPLGQGFDSGGVGGGKGKQGRKSIGRLLKTGKGEVNNPKLSPAGTMLSFDATASSPEPPMLRRFESRDQHLMPPLIASNNSISDSFDEMRGLSNGIRSAQSQQYLQPQPQPQLQEKGKRKAIKNFFKSAMGNNSSTSLNRPQQSMHRSNRSGSFDTNGHPIRYPSISSQSSGVTQPSSKGPVNGSTTSIPLKAEPTPQLPPKPVLPNIPQTGTLRNAQIPQRVDRVEQLKMGQRVPYMFPAPVAQAIPPQPNHLSPTGPTSDKSVTPAASHAHLDEEESITPTIAHATSGVNARPPAALLPAMSFEAFPSELATVLQDTVHAGSAWIEHTSAKGIWQPVLIVLTLRKISLPPAAPLPGHTTSISKASLANLHFFPMMEGDKVLDRAGSLGRRTSMAHGLTGKERMEFSRRKIAWNSDVEAVDAQNSNGVGYTISVETLGGGNAENEQYSLQLPDSRSGKEWMLQIKTVVAELASERETSEWQKALDLAPFARHSSLWSASGPIASVARRHSVSSQRYASRDTPSSRTDPYFEAERDWQNTLRQAPAGLRKRNSIGSIASGSIMAASVTSRSQSSALHQARADMRAKWAGKPPPSSLAQLPSSRNTSEERRRPNIVIPEARNKPSALLPETQLHQPAQDSLSTPTPSLSADNSSNTDASPGNRSAVSPIDHPVPSIPGVLHYVDPSNGKAYEVPPGMLKAFLAGAGAMGMSGWGDVGLSPGATGTSLAGSRDSLRPSNASAISDSRRGSITTSRSTPFAYDDKDRYTPSLTSNNAYAQPERSSSTLTAHPVYPQAVQHLQADRTRMDTSSSAAFPPSPILATPSPSTIQSSTFTGMSETTNVTSTVPYDLPRIKELGDRGSTRTFGTQSGSDEGNDSMRSSVRRERKAGNLRERMRKMKMDNQLSGGDLDIMNEAEVLDPWEEPEPIEAYPVRRKEPTVRFA